MGEYVPDGQKSLENDIRAAEMFILFPVRSHSFAVADFRLPPDDGRFIHVLKREVLSPKVIQWIATKYFKSPIPVRAAAIQSIRVKTLAGMQEQSSVFSIPTGISITITRFDLNDLFRQKDTPIMRILAEKTIFDELEQARNRYNLLEEAEFVRFRTALLTGKDDPLIWTVWQKKEKAHG